MEVRRPATGRLASASSRTNALRAAYRPAPGVSGAGTLQEGVGESKDREELSRLLREAARLMETADLSGASETLGKATDLARRRYPVSSAPSERERDSPRG